MYNKAKQIIKQSLHDDFPQGGNATSSSSFPYLPASSESEIVIPCPNPLQCVSFTTNGWTGADHESYICVTAHWLDLSWQMRHALLDIWLCTDRHTGDNLDEWLQQVLQKNDISVCLILFNWLMSFLS